MRLSFCLMQTRSVSRASSRETGYAKRYCEMGRVFPVETIGLPAAPRDNSVAQQTQTRLLEQHDCVIGCDRVRKEQASAGSRTLGAAPMAGDRLELAQAG